MAIRRKQNSTNMAFIIVIYPLNLVQPFAPFKTVSSVRRHPQWETMFRRERFVVHFEASIKSRWTVTVLQVCTHLSQVPFIGAVGGKGRQVVK